MKLIIRPATRQDVLRILPLIRREDIEEWLMQRSGFSSEVLAHDLMDGVVFGEAWYAEERAPAHPEGSGAPVAIGGLCQRGGFLAPWLMATPAIARHGKEALRWGRATLRRWKAVNLPLANVVSVKHVRAVRFIKACGYELYRAVCANGELYFLFGVNHV